MDKAFEKRKKVVYDLMCDSLYTPMKFKELAMLLQVPKEKRDELRQILEALEAEGKIYLSKRGKYCKGEAKKLTGVYRGNLKGFGFILMEDESPDVFVAEENINGAFDGDTVEFTIGPGTGREKPGRKNYSDCRKRLTKSSWSLSDETGEKLWVCHPG